ncbi:MAG: succinylglutamate desuccinylase/aspartoacylase family protein [Gammaproteobacteria bacterium]|nr:succinylglutamate desuccinylase/aspartoacylase family protein [Gammaproteobacteria bacterium]
MNPNDVIAQTTSSSIDFDGAGKQLGHLGLAAETDHSAWGTVQIPLCVISHGQGPTVALLSGLHGDATVGTAALHRLINELEPHSIQGTLIIIPTINTTAQAIGQRFSPLDNKNLNRCFPGDPQGTFSDRLAHLITEQIISRSDIVVDVHSGGSSMEFTPLAAVHFRADKVEQKRAEELMIAFGAPNSLRLLEVSDRGMLDSVVEEANKIFVTTELGGGGTATSTQIRSCLIGCRNVLVQSGLLQQELALRMSRMLEIRNTDGYLVAPRSGLLDMHAELGSDVYRGDPIAQIINPEQVGTATTPILATFNGVLIARHYPGRVSQGDCIAVLADEVQR